MRVPQSIGTRRETSLHRDLKFSYAGQGGQTETEVAGFVADGISATGEFIEVQTGSFGPLRKKAKKLAARGKVRIVYPVIITKYIEVFDIAGNRKYRRKSNKRGSPWDIFDALIYAPDLPLVRGIVIELALVDVTERRIQDGNGSWRRRGVSIQDRQLMALHERICLKKPADYVRFVPFSEDENFTSAILGEKAGIGVDMARKALYVLSKLGVVRKVGKQGNTLVYQAVLTPKTGRNNRNN